jgi:hypothetical protein
VTSTTGSSKLALETLVDAHRRHEASQAFTKTSLPAQQSWSQPFPSRAQELPLPDGAAHNVLHVTAAPMLLGDESFDIGAAPQRLVVTTAAKAVCVFDAPSTTHADPTLIVRWTPQDAPVLAWTVLTPEWSVGAAMSGQVVLFSTRRGSVMAQRRDHRKYVVRVAAVETDNNEAAHGGKTFYLATAGWDTCIHLYRLHLASSDAADFPQPTATLELPSNPEDVHFCSRDSGTTLIVTRRDSAALHYFAVPSLAKLGSQTLAPHSGPWTPFSLTSISASPIDGGLVAVATSGTEYTKLLIVRLLLPDRSSAAQADSAPPAEADADTEAQRTRAALAKEDAAAAAAIRLAVSTHSPSSAWSTPKAVWRPDGSGVWVNGDDGAVRGVEVASGRVVVALGPQGEGVLGHVVDAKVRDIWAGWAGARIGEDQNGGHGGEWLLSAGFDRRALLWTAPVER